MTSRASVIFTLSSIQQSRRATCKNRMKETYRNGHPCSAGLRLHTVRPLSYLNCVYRCASNRKQWCALYRVYVAARIFKTEALWATVLLTLLASGVDTVRCWGGGGLLWPPWLKSSQPEKQKEGGRKWWGDPTNWKWLVSTITAQVHGAVLVVLRTLLLSSWHAIRDSMLASLCYAQCIQYLYRPYIIQP